MLNKHYDSWNLDSRYLHDTDPATDWAEAYPLGDGRIGAKIWSNPCKEIISLNHDLLWRNYLKQPTYGTAQDMELLRILCIQKRWREAEEVLEKTLPSRGAIYINPFVSAFDQYISMFLPEEKVENYQRWLDMEHGIVHTQFSAEGVVYHRAHFCSAESGLFVTHMTTSIPGMLTGKLSLSRMPDPECSVTGGAGRDHVFCEAEFEEGVRFAAVSKILHRNGRLTSQKSKYGLENDGMAEKKYGNACTFDRDEFLNDERGASVCFDHSDEIWIITALSVDAESEMPLNACYNALMKDISYEALYESHCNRFSEYYNRTNLRFGNAGDEDYSLTTPQLIQRDRESQKLSPALCELACNMSRYTAISSGMPRLNSDAIKAPINLQGIWNRDSHPVWESDYHTDLNLEMCYWPLPLMGLADCMEPLLDMMERLLPQARYLAQDMYGCRGAVYSGCFDYKTIGLNDVNPGGSFGITAWLVQILWMYYEHSPHRELLVRIYNLMREIDIFYQAVFYEDENGLLTFPFGASPEMCWRLDSGLTQFLSSPSTFDLTVVKEFYVNLHTAARLLGDTDYAEQMGNIASRIAAPHILEDGMLCEWTEPHDEVDIGHRHRSPFVAFCPGSLYSVESDPDMVKAMEKLLKKRQSVGNKSATAFSFPLDAQILVRMRRADDAFLRISDFLYYYSLGNLMFAFDDWEMKLGGATWFPGIKVMQVEAQLGMYAVFAEMVYQDTQGIIRLLPALPQALDCGSAEGIRGRNGVICNLVWTDGIIKKFSISISAEGEYQILPPLSSFYLMDKNGNLVDGKWNGNIYTFLGNAGETYLYTAE